MKYFDYESVAREGKIPSGKTRKLLKIIGQEFPNDRLMRELHMLRACMAIRDGRIRIDDLLKSDAEDHP